MEYTQSDGTVQNMNSAGFPLSIAPFRRDAGLRYQTDCADSSTEISVDKRFGDNNRPVSPAAITPPRRGSWVAAGQPLQSKAGDTKLEVGRGLMDGGSVADKSRACNPARLEKPARCRYFPPHYFIHCIRPCPPKNPPNHPRSHPPSHRPPAPRSRRMRFRPRCSNC